MQKRTSRESVPGVKAAQAAGRVDLLGRAREGESVLLVGPKLGPRLHGALDRVGREEHDWRARQAMWVSFAKDIYVTLEPVAHCCTTCLPRLRRRRAPTPSSRPCQARPLPARARAHADA
jgi:hypothetical protein